MTKKEMEKRLIEIIKNSATYNEVCGQFAEMVMYEHLGIDASSIEIGKDFSLTPGLPFKRTDKYIYRPGRYRNQ